MVPDLGRTWVFPRIRCPVLGVPPIVIIVLHLYTAVVKKNGGAPNRRRYTSIFGSIVLDPLFVKAPTWKISKVEPMVP